MKFNLDSQHAPLPSNRAPEVGDVYPAKGGRGDTIYWIIVGTTMRGGCAVLGIDGEGQVISAQSYNASAFKDRPLLGRCQNLAELSFDIEWEPRS